MITGNVALQSSEVVVADIGAFAYSCLARMLDTNQVRQPQPTARKIISRILRKLGEDGF